MSNTQQHFQTSDIEMSETPQLDPDTVTNAIMADDDPEIQGSTAMSPEPMESMPQAFSNPLASSTPFPNQPTTLSPEPMESMPQPFPDPLASSTPIPSQPTTMSPEPMESMPQTTPNPLASPTPLPNPITSQTSLSPYTLHQTAPPFTPTTEGPALTSPPSGIATRPSLKRGLTDDTMMDFQGNEDSEGSSGYPPYHPLKVRIVTRGNRDEKNTSSEDQETELAKYQEKLHLALNENSTLQRELALVSVHLEQKTSLAEDLTKKELERDLVRKALEQEMENIKADAVRRSGELEIKLAEMTQHSEAIRTQSKAVEERLTEEGLTRDLARRALEQEMERIKEDAALRFKEHKIKLAEITRHAETTQANLNIVEECVTGWKARCHEVESERDRAKADVEKLTQFRQDQLNIAETCVIGWKDQCQQVKSELSQMREAYESLSGAHRERSQLIEERKRQLDEITATAEKDQEDLKRHIEVILGERDRATAELNRQSKGHQQALLDIEQKHEARIGALRDTNDITTGDLHAAHDASIQEAEILKHRIESIQYELGQATQSRAEHEADHRQSLLDMTKKYEDQIVALKQSHDKSQTELQAAHTASTEAAVLRAVAAANQSRENAVDEASTLRGRLEDIKLERDQTNLAQKQQHEEHQQTLLDIAKNHEAQLFDLQETHTKSKADLENSNRSSIDEAIQKERDHSVQALKQQDDVYEILSLDMARKQDEHKEELATLRETHAKEKEEMVEVNELAFRDWLAQRVPEIRREEQEKSKALLDEAVKEISKKAEKAHLDMQQKIAEIKRQSDLDRQKAERLEAEIARLHRHHGNHSQNFGSGVNRAQPGSSRCNDGDVGMEGLSDRARGKRPEFFDLPRTRGSKPSLKRQPRLFSTDNNRDQPTEPPAREDTPLGDYLRTRAQPTTSENIVPPMRFSRPYGADTPLADRLRMPSPPTLPRSRSQTPFMSRRPSISASIHSISSSFGFPNTSLRGESPIAPPFSSSDGVPGETPVRPPTPGPSNPNAPHGHPSFNPDAASTEALRDVLQNFASGMTSDLEQLRGELQKTQKLFSSRQQKTSRKTDHGDFKTKTPPRPRATARTEMMASARLEINTLLGIKFDTEITRIVKATPVVCPEEVAEFEDGAGDPPSLKPLRPYWDVVQSTWNHHLAHAFAIDFMTEYGEDLVTTQKEVAEFFLQRLETLRKHIHRLIPVKEGESAEEITARVAQQEEIRRAVTRRRGRVERRFEARLKICQEGTNNANQDSALAWQILFSLVDTLGKDGQSSDETDGDNHAVHIKDWRSDDVKQLLLYIDANRKTTNASGTRIGGVRTSIRVRRAYGPLSARHAVAGLPRNFYNTVWYDGLSRIQQVQLGAIDNIQFPHIEDL